MGMIVCMPPVDYPHYARLSSFGKLISSRLITRRAARHEDYRAAHVIALIALRGCVISDPAQKPLPTPHEDIQCFSIGHAVE